MESLVILFFNSLILNMLPLLRSSVPVQLELRLALILIITTPTHPIPPRKIEMQLEIDHIRSVGSWWIVGMVIFGGRG